MIMTLLINRDNLDIAKDIPIFFMMIALFFRALTWGGILRNEIRLSDIADLRFLLNAVFIKKILSACLTLTTISKYSQ